MRDWRGGEHQFIAQPIRTLRKTLLAIYCPCSMSPNCGRHTVTHKVYSCVNFSYVYSTIYIYSHRAGCMWTCGAHQRISYTVITIMNIFSQQQVRVYYIPTYICRYQGVVYLGWPIGPRIWAQMREWGGWELRGLSHYSAHGSQINFGYLTPYLTYDTD